jgi:hypothetical protein
MGRSARLYTNATLDQVEEVLEAKAENTPVVGMARVVLNGKKFDLNYHFKSDNPLGDFPCLSAWRNSKAEVEALGAVAKKFGGLLERDDHEGTLEFVYPDEA